MHKKMSEVKLPQSMDAVRVMRYCETVDHIKNCIKIDRIPLPSCGSNDVLIEVHAASINPIDYKMVLGFLQLVLSPPFSAGFDFSGRVVAVGASCSRIAVNDKVYGMANFMKTGSFAQYMTVSEDLVAVMPTNLSYAEAASVPMAALTSLQALELLKIEPNSGGRVLILGGSGGTGSMGVQIAAAALGMKVTTTSSQIEFVIKLGAERVINYKDSDFTVDLRDAVFDGVYDTVGGYESWEKCCSQNILKPGGRYVTIAGDAQTSLTVAKLACVGASTFNRKFWSMFGWPSYTYISQTDSHHIQLTRITQWLQNGIVKPVIDSEFPLHSIAEAYARIASSRAHGKVVITINHDETPSITSGLAPEDASVAALANVL